ncbi:MAG: hypothetical protein WA160_16055 [Pseudobdellovibrio sp.]
MEKSKLIIAYERDKINEDIGSNEDKIIFMQEFPKVGNFNKEFTQFYCTGLFQLPSGPPILILPWFLKNINTVNLNSKKTYHFVDVINKIIRLRKQSQSLSNIEHNIDAKDLIIYSYLIKLEVVANTLLEKSVQVNIEDETNVIKGRWLVEKNLKNGKRPTNFFCKYNSVDKSSPELIFIKSFCLFFLGITKSKTNYSTLKRIEKLLSGVDTVMFSKKLATETLAKLDFKQNTSENLSELISFAESLCFSSIAIKNNVGFSFTIEMDSFFEDLMAKFISLSRVEISEQKREDLLGGANWISSNLDLNLQKDRLKATQATIPDIVVKNKDYIAVIDCKYKPLQIPFINDDDSINELTRFCRDDRNQILSFILSVKPSFELRTKKPVFSILFPCITIEKFKFSSLLFDSTKLEIDQLSKSLSQNTSKQDSNQGLKIRFAAVNINTIIKLTLEKDSQSSEDFLTQLTEAKDSQANIIVQDNIVDINQRRLLVSTLAVHKNKNDSTLGQVKMAKILYLADSHLNLGLNGVYERRPYGPLDHKMIYGKNVGINSLGEKNAIFKFVKNDKLGKYIKGKNIEFAVKKAEKIFSSKLVNLNWLIDLLLPLNSTQAEIVSTLYACWNDLICDNKVVSDEAIINDFLVNWHPAKNKFIDNTNRLQNALNWMRKNKLVPDGSFQKTLKSYDSNASDF